MVIAMGCSPKPTPPIPPGDSGIDEPSPDAGFSGDAGLFEINNRRDAGDIIVDSGLPWTWASV